MIKAIDLVKTYRTKKEMPLEILKKVSLQIEEGKISIIVGASGAGKSTLLHLLGGLDHPDSGQVFYDSDNIASYSEEKLAKFRNRNIGFIFQFHHLLPEFTALENIAIPQMIAGLSLKKALEKGKYLLEVVSLSDRMDHKPAELSGGEQQRVAVARALANDPQVILADEPTGNLDSANSQSVHNLLVKLRDEMKKTFVVVTHNPELVNLGDKVFEIKDGIIT
jgi:lipoprotein-releasing system ATP-binding protein